MALHDTLCAMLQHNVNKPLKECVSFMVKFCQAEGAPSVFSDQQQLRTCTELCQRLEVSLALLLLMFVIAWTSPCCCRPFPCINTSILSRFEDSRAVYRGLEKARAVARDVEIRISRQRGVVKSAPNFSPYCSSAKAL